MQTTEKKPETKKAQNPKRAQLIALSNQAKELRESMAEAAETEAEAIFWASRTVNYMLLNHFYASKDDNLTFNTFNQWRKENATVKKGAKAFLIWGQPLSEQRKKQAEAKGTEASEEDEYSFFPVCYLFSNLQVTTAEEMEAEREKTRLEIAKKAEKAEALKNVQTVDLDDINL